MIKYKQKCWRCKKNYVEVSRGQKYAMCYDCQKDELKAPIKDPKMKKMFNVPEDFYKRNAFLRDIKANYLRFGNLSEKQVEAFKEVSKKMKEQEKDA